MKTYNIEGEVTLSVVMSKEFDSQEEADAYADSMKPREYDPGVFEVLGVIDFDVIDVWAVE